MDYSLKQKQIFVTGASGLIGSRVTQKLLEEGAYVKALVRNPLKAGLLAQMGADIVLGDITDLNAVKNALQGCQLVFHFAGVLNEYKPWTYYRAVNVKGTELLAQAALEANVERFIHTSTVYVYGKKTVGFVSENSPRYKSNDPYADTKLEAELSIQSLITEKKFPAIIIQPSQVYGPNDLTWTRGPIKMIRKGSMLLVNKGKGLVQPVYVDDLVYGVISAAKKGVIGETYILCGSEPVTIRTFFGYYANMIGKSRLPTVPFALAYAIAGMAELLAKLFDKPPVFTMGELSSVIMHTVYDGTKAKDDLQWEASTSLPDGMREVRKWFTTIEEKQ